MTYVSERKPAAIESLYVSDQQGLDLLVKRLREGLAKDPRLAFDTEFIRERTYLPVLEIVQVATSDGLIALLDVPALKGDLGGLVEMFSDPNILKIVHAGGQDAEILTSLFGNQPLPLFDTQIAAAFAGYSLQMGYGALVQAVLNVRLAKDEGFADWSRRPLTPAMRDYAENDVRYLHELHDKLNGLLVKRGRTEWADEQTRRMVDNATEQTPPEELWRRVSGKTVLDRQGLAILRELAKWRDEEAARRDKPRRTVVKDDLLIEVARRGSQTGSEIVALRTAPTNLGERTAAVIAERVKIGKAAPKAEWPEKEEASPLDEHGAVLLELMAAVVRLRAMEASLPPSLLANGDDLRTLASGRSRPDETGPLFNGWRGELIGSDLRDLLSGRLTLGYDPKRRRVTVERKREESAGGE